MSSEYYQWAEEARRSSPLLANLKREKMLLEAAGEEVDFQEDAEPRNRTSDLPDMDTTMDEQREETALEVNKELIREMYEDFDWMDE
ncbi:uncharacterized protein BKA78DRAFT_356315 [Phyllosticta capitalensis]|uniref:uncharacterized protein n=1 Tax=Phyllosticta capitalensis TaxID=121624 RepID=UPI00312CED93